MRYEWSMRPDEVGWGSNNNVYERSGLSIECGMIERVKLNTLPWFGHPEWIKTNFYLQWHPEDSRHFRAHISYTVHHNGSVTILSQFSDGAKVPILLFKSSYAVLGGFQNFIGWLYMNMLSVLQNWSIHQKSLWNLKETHYVFSTDEDNIRKCSERSLRVSESYHITERHSWSHLRSSPITPKLIQLPPFSMSYLGSNTSDLPLQCHEECRGKYNTVLILLRTILISKLYNL